MLPTELPVWAGYIACGIYMGLEYWLGKTGKVESGSVLEMALNTVGGFCKALIGKELPKNPALKSPKDDE